MVYCTDAGSYLVWCADCLCNIELDKVLGNLLSQLEEAGKDLSEGQDKFRNTLILWNAGMEEEPVMDRLGVVSGKSLGLVKKFSDAKITIRDGGWDINYPNCLQGNDPVGCNERIGKASLRMDSERFAEVIKIIKEDEELMK